MMKTFQDIEHEFLQQLQKGYSFKYERLYSISDDYHCLVKLCESGYGDWLNEYDNDIAVRGLIETILNSVVMQDYPEFQAWKLQIDEIDQRIRAIFLPGHFRTETNTWWTMGILGNGVDYYAQDVEETYGVQL